MDGTSADGRNNESIITIPRTGRNRVNQTSIKAMQIGIPYYLNSTRD